VGLSLEEGLAPPVNVFTAQLRAFLSLLSLFHRMLRFFCPVTSSYQMSEVMSSTWFREDRLVAPGVLSHYTIYRHSHRYIFLNYCKMIPDSSSYNSIIRGALTHVRRSCVVRNKKFYHFLLFDLPWMCLRVPRNYWLQNCPRHPFLLLSSLWRRWFSTHFFTPFFTSKSES